MAKPRRRHKIPDEEKTKARLLEAVSQIMRETGFQGLTVMNITRWIGKDKGVINYHYGNLAHLQRLYIKEKDYWPRFFERFQLNDNPKPIEIRLLFKELMRENFRFFQNNMEMQKIILWQISEKNPLTRKVSEAREEAGAKLLKLTDRYFVGTGISFKAIGALLLGGIYYVITHAENNKSTVCGMDANIEFHQQIFIETIGQVIDWAWEKAEENQKFNNEMKLDFEVLEAIVNDLINRSKDNLPSLEKPDTLLSQEVRRLENIIETHLLYLKNPTQISGFLNVALIKLVRICNGLYEVYQEVSPDTIVIMDLIGHIKQIVPQNVSPNVPLPKAFVVLQSPLLNNYWKELNGHLNSLGIDPILIQIAGLPFKLFERQQSRLNWGDYTWLKRYLNYAGNIDWENHECGSKEEALISLLIRLGYNHQRFFAYCYRLTRSKVEAKKGLKEKLKELARCKTLILQDVQLSDQRFDNRTEKISVQLCNWIDAETTMVLAMETGEVESFNNPYKLILNMNMLGTALWFKLQYDHSIIIEDNLDILAEKVIQNYSTKQQADLSAGSLKTKFYSKDPAAIQFVEALLIKMLDEIRGYQ